MGVVCCWARDLILLLQHDAKVGLISLLGTSILTAREQVIAWLMGSSMIFLL